MKTIEKVMNGGVSLMCLLLFISQQSIAQSVESTQNTHGMESSAIGFIIVGSVLGFGIIAYLIISRLEKNEKKEEPASNIRHISHRHQHHHRVIKKSA